LKDGTQYTNHSSNANTQTYFHPNKDINKSIAISLRDIKKGE
jgi:SET domain-containing protein